MLGVDPEFHCHRPVICLDARLVAQRKRKLNLERGKFMDKEAKKLLSARFIREVQYITWFVNVVRVKKSNGK